MEVYAFKVAQGGEIAQIKRRVRLHGSKSEQGRFVKEWEEMGLTERATGAKCKRAKSEKKKKTRKKIVFFF